MTRHTLPWTVRHLHPGIGPSNIKRKRLTRFIGPLGFNAPGRYARISKSRNFYVGVLGTGKLGGFQYCQRLGLVQNLPVTIGIHELVGQQRSEQVLITCLNRLKPLLFQCGYLHGHRMGNGVGEVAVVMKGVNAAFLLPRDAALSRCKPAARLGAIDFFECVRQYWRDQVPMNDDFRVLGAQDPSDAAEILRELGEDDLAVRLQSGISTVRSSGAFSSGLPVWPFQDCPWQHTAHAFGYLGLAQGSSKDLLPIRFAGAIEPDQTLDGAGLRITLDRLRVADYPGRGMHNILFDFYARNQTRRSAEHLHYNVYLRVNEGQEAAVIGHPIFVGLKVGSEGLSFRGRTVNVKNESDESMLRFLESDTFRSGLRLVTTAQPAVAPLSEMVVGLTTGLLKRTRNVLVQDFYMGLDFSSVQTGARLAQGSYIIVQIPDRMQRVWDWEEWLYDPEAGALVGADDRQKLIPYNYVVLGITKMREE